MPLIAGRYRLGETLGVGGMGKVWQARDEVLQRDVAIKEVLLPDDLPARERELAHRRTLREARAAARLGHPNVVQVFDVLDVDGRAWIVMAYVPSRSLHEVLRTTGPLDPRRAARVGLELLAALKAAHSAGVDHRDVKPANVLLADDGRVLLTDFGIATIEGDSQISSSDMLIGSPEYISPERARDGTAGLASDLWSLGATLYAAVEGHSPFHRSSALASLTALAADEPDPPKQAGVLGPVLKGLLRKDPAERINATEAEHLLRKAVAGAYGHALVPTQPEVATTDSLPAAVPPPAADGASPPPPLAPAGAPAAVLSTTAAASAVPSRRPAPDDVAAAPSSSMAAASSVSAERPASDDVGAAASSVSAQPPASDDVGAAASSVSAERPASDDVAVAASSSMAAASSVSAERPASGDVAAARSSTTAPAEPLPSVAAQRTAPGDVAAVVPSATVEPPAQRSAPGSAPSAAPPTPAVPAQRPSADGPASPSAASTSAANAPGAGSSAFQPDPGRADPPHRGRATPVPVGPEARPPAAPARRWLLAAALAVVAMIAGAVVWGVTRSGSDTKPPAAQGPTASAPGTPTSAPSSTSGGAAPPATSAAPAPTSAATQAPPDDDAGGTGSGSGLPKLPEGWRDYRDRTGFAVYVPEGWTQSREKTMVYFRDSRTGRVLGIDQTRKPAPNPVADWRGKADYRVGRGDFPSYREIHIREVDYFQKAADWEFTFTRNGVRQHVNNRGVITSKKQAYGFYWQTPDASWARYRDDLQLVFDSFRPRS